MANITLIFYQSRSLAECHVLAGAPVLTLLLYPSMLLLTLALVTDH